MPDALGHDHGVRCYLPLRVGREAHARILPRHLGGVLLGDAYCEVPLDGLLNAARRASGGAGDIQAGQAGHIGADDQDEEAADPEASHPPADAGGAAVRVRAADQYALAVGEPPLLEREDGREDEGGDKEAEPRAGGVRREDVAEHLAHAGLAWLGLGLGFGLGLGVGCSG